MLQVASLSAQQKLYEVQNDDEFKRLINVAKLYSFLFTAVLCCGYEGFSHFLSFQSSYKVEIFEFATSCKTKRGGVETHRPHSSVHSLLPPSREQLQ